MADEPAWGQPFEEEDAGPVLPRRPVQDTAEMDITPMIDITFLLLIFFLVCSTAAMQSAVELPPARHGTGISDRNAVILTVQDQGKTSPVRVYVADGIKGEHLPDDPDLQAAAITEAVDHRARQGRVGGPARRDVAGVHRRGTRRSGQSPRGRAGGRVTPFWEIVRPSRDDSISLQSLLAVADRRRRPCGGGV
jgi:hypothetical protein